MNKSKIIKQIAKQRSKNKHVTKRFIGSLSCELLQYCEEKEEETGRHWKEFLHRRLYGIGRCKLCGSKKVKYKGQDKGWYTYCSVKCAQNDPEVEEKYKASMLENHGVEYTAQSKKLRKKMMKTCNDNYGVDYGVQSDVAKEKSKNTMLERYGVEHAFQSKEIREKFEKTMMDRYGVKHALQNDSFLEKAQATLLRNYGVKFCMQNPDLRKKHAKTIKKNYGVDHNWSSKEIRANIKDTMLEKYGIEFLWQNKKYREQFENTMLERYNVRHPGQSEAIMDKRKKTMLERYGTESPIQNESIKEKIKNTMNNKYGVEYAMQNRESFEKNQESAGWTKKVCIKGKEFFVRGYEETAIKYLIWKGTDVTAIKTTHKDGAISIPYKFKNKDKVYHPDICLTNKKKTIIVEVKSLYTLGVSEAENKTTYQRIKTKASACVSSGFEFRLLLVLKNRIITIHNLHEKTRKEVRQGLLSLHPELNI
jgi:hypothetical protein